MHLTFSLSVLAQQAAGIPWKVLIITGLLLVTGIVLTVYFFRRFKKSEAETEEDWNLSRSTLLGAAQPARPPAEVRAAEQKDIETSDANRAVETPTSLKPPVDQKEKQPVVEYNPEPKPAPVMDKTPQRAEPERPPALAEEHATRVGEVPSAPVVEARRPEQQPQRGTDLSAEVPPEVPSIGAHTIAPPGVTDDEYHKSLQQPLEEEIWADLEVPQVPPVRGEAPIGRRTRREPFEPPRIEPLVARDRAAGQTTGETASVQSRRSSSAALEAPHRPSEHKPAGEIATPAPSVSSAGFQPSGRRSLSQPAGSILGLPAEATSGPLVLGEPRRYVDESDIGTLSNYGKESDDGAGHGGTIALVVVILIIAGVLLAYLFVPSVHSSIDGMVARAKGTRQEEPPRAQVFKATYDATKTPIEATGIVQNISQETLKDLSVEVKLERKGGGGTDTKTVPVTPSEIAPNAQGTFQFELDGKQYQRYGVIRLLGEKGAEVKFVKPDQEK